MTLWILVAVVIGIVVVAAAAGGGEPHGGTLLSGDARTISGGTDAAGASPLHHATESGDFETVKSQIASGADVNARAMIRQVDIATGASRMQGQGNTPLIIAAAQGHAAIVGYLLDHGADVDMVNANGATALFMAVQRGYVECAMTLLEKGRANPNILTENGAVALHVAAQYGQTELARQLLAKGAVADVATVNGDSPLHSASLHGHEAIVEGLLAQGADANRQDRNGNSPLHVAAYGGHVGIVRRLLDACGRTGLRNQAGQTPADLACQGPSAKAEVKPEVLALVGSA